MGKQITKRRGRGVEVLTKEVKIKKRGEKKEKKCVKNQ